MGGQLASQAKVEDRYYLQKVKLGQGAFGTVWRAVDRQTEDVVAVKQLNKAAFPRRGISRADILREVEVMKALSHENITSLFSYFEDDDSMFLALEYCDGGDFGDKVQERGMELKEEEAAEWMRQIMSALACMHAKSICHRDIKPDNFMVHRGLLKVSDFGLATFVERGKRLKDKCGTPAFMSPELHGLPKDSRGYHLPCDVWAAGVSMYMLMFGGRHPFLASSSGGSSLDMRLLLKGTLDFQVSSGFLKGIAGLAGLVGELRYSEEARNLCQRMVEPVAERRITASQAAQDTWIKKKAVPSSAGKQPQQPSPPDKPPQQKKQEPTAKQTDKQAAVASSKKRPSKTKASTDDGRQNPSRPESEGLAKKIQELEKKLKAQEEEREAMETDRKALEKDRELLRKLTEQAKQKACQGQLPEGCQVRYFSTSSGGWIPAVIEGFNFDDGTYDLNARPHAETRNISPCPNVAAAGAWPAGTLVFYESSSMQHWLPAVVLSYNEGSEPGGGTYNLDLRSQAAVENIRPRCE
mmetsp:Transcript_64856/g.140723  ORF Transcript_64856/g.140723 Transcript_64856/m.140723 type:complete len:525 (+) Transcript_64856:185-1759(+)|eukprot:CAMPEP_0206535676 /NCGR_PEP_ID=MMETSP0325_2-20121206/6286_1 /ASSEMBLY_ACC=CAM_ASM_000347 /TAXON_ID=2866 /ORGANISM="Crypthecodinium cohnii, Strain Seligo" /LENGTH=524 /DNA_ID=CAMNT_0054032723 /DNA_START=101 /DNA_END=1675 /DNA_ORIENTATION=+